MKKEINNTNLNLKLLSNEMKLLLCLAMDDQQIDHWLNNHDIDWHLFIDLARHHRVYPVVYQRVKGLFYDRIPTFVLECLNKDYRYNTFQMLFLTTEMESMANSFNENMIKAIFLKGPVLANALYGELSLRTSSDLDILVPMNDLFQVEDILTRKGYVKDDYINTVLNDWKWRHHHFSYFHPTKKTKIEIHWRLNPGPAKEQPFENLWNRRRVTAITSTPIHILGKEDLFLFLVLHGARHGWSRLRWLMDIKQMIIQPTDWAKIQQLLKEYHGLHVAGQALILCSELLGSEIPWALSKTARKKRSRKLAIDAMFYIRQQINLHSEPLPYEIAQYHRQHLFTLMPIQQKVLFKLSLLFPYPIDAETLSLPKKFHFLYFPLRPFLWIWRKTRKSIPEGARK